MTNDAADRLKEEFRNRLDKYRSALKVCRSDLGAQAVHDARVAMRRLMAAFDLFDALRPDLRLKKSRRKIRKHRERFSALRDCQVRIALVDALSGEFPAVQPYRERLKEKEARAQAKTARKFKGISVDPAAQAASAIKRRLSRLAFPSAEAVTILRRETAELGETMIARRPAEANADSRTWHKFRRRVKKFRYRLEMIRPLHPVATDDVMRKLHELQTLLGDLIDLENLIAAIEKFQRRKGAIEKSGAVVIRSSLDDRLADLKARAVSASEWLPTLFQLLRDETPESPPEPSTPAAPDQK